MVFTFLVKQLNGCRLSFYSECAGFCHSLILHRSIFLFLFTIRLDYQRYSHSHQIIYITQNTTIPTKSINIQQFLSFPLNAQHINYSQNQKQNYKYQINETNIMSGIGDIPIPQLYREVNHITDHGISGYYVAKKYQDPVQMMKSRQLSNSTGKLKKYQTKRGNYLDDASNVHKFVPGPGKYTYSLPWPVKSKSLHHPSKKLTYIDEIMKRQKKQKKPAPGHYNLIKSDKQIAAQNKKLASRKIKYDDKISYLDHVQYQALQSPGAGMYNPRQRVKTQVSKLNVKPQDWRKKHQNMEKNKKLPKMPDMRTYNPIPVEYSLFSINDKLKRNKNFLGKVDRFKTQPSGSGLGPGKYQILQEWRGKQIKKKQRHGLESLSKGMSKSVYYH